MSSSEGFWPGEAPAKTQEDVQEPEAPIADPPSWPQAREEQALRAQPQPEVEQEVEPEIEQGSVAETAVAETAAAQPEPEAEEEPEPEAAPAEHVAGELDIPDGVAVLEGSPSGAERTVGVVVSRFNGEISNRLLKSALEALAAAGVPEERITVMPVPGAFELPIGAMALAKTRRYSCVIALGCVVRGETAHFEYVAGEAASGLQLAGLETGVPVAFGVLTVDTTDQAEARVDKGADAARAALEMADLFSQVRKQARA
jgi:6,7-dimethyl-8-ribityllumazine synthase